AQAITNGPAAQRGTYVGTFCTNSAAAANFIWGGVSLGGTPGFFHLWNNYNRVRVASICADSNQNWTYAGTGSNVWRYKNNNTTNRFNFLAGLQEDPFQLINVASSTAGNTSVPITQTGIGVDSNTPHINSSTLQANTAAGGDHNGMQTSVCDMQFLG